MSATILTVSPEPTILASLGFLLEAEGWRVDLRERLPALAPAIEICDCAVVDCKAIVNKINALQSLQALQVPVILLVDGYKNYPVSEGIRVVEKPILGSSLVEAIIAGLAVSPVEHYLSTQNPLGA